MSFISDLIAWATSGTRDAEYSDAKKAAGWEIGEPPVARRWNAREYERDTLINYTKHLAEAAHTAPPQASVDDLCGGFLSTSWHKPTDSINTTWTGIVIVDACLGFNTSTNRPFIWVLRNDGDIYKITGCWDYSATPLLSSAVTLSYPTTPDRVLSLCADSEYLYVLWDTSAGNYRVTKFTYAGAEVWTTDTGVLSALGASGECDKIILADADNVAVTLPTYAFGDVLNRTIGILTKAAGTMTSGTGSWVSGTGDAMDYQNAKIVSNGDHIFWVGYQLNTERYYYLMSAKISSPATSDYASSSIRVESASEPWTWPKGLVNIGGDIVITCPDGAVGVYSITDEDVKWPFYFNAASGFPANLEDAQDVVAGFDGQRLWYHFLYYDSGPPRNNNIIQVIPAGEINGRVHYGGPAGTNTHTAGNPIAIETATFQDTYVDGKLIFDGQDMWWVRRNGYVYRLTNPGAR